MKFVIDIYSPRWGHTDNYYLEFENKSLTIKQTNGRMEIARLLHVLDSDPEWQDNNALFRMLRNEHIHPPHNLPDLLEHIWKAWRNDDLNEKEVQAELNELAEYISECSKAKPKSEFWKAYD